MNDISPLSSQDLLIINSQMNQCICKIYIKHGVGTGFFCLISFPNGQNKIPVLITCNHILKDEDLQIEKKINISFSNDEKIKEILIKKDRKIYTSREKDITIIEIKPNDDISNFLELDYEVLSPQFKYIYKYMSVYTLHYPRGDKAKVSFGIIKEINEEEGRIIHNCFTEPGSCGGPILSNSSFKVIGIHVGTLKQFNQKFGLLLYKSIIDFQKLKE